MVSPIGNGRAPYAIGLILIVAFVLLLVVFLDATVVRVLLVPATMALLGARNWYVPRWLERRLPNVRFSH